MSRKILRISYFTKSRERWKRRLSLWFQVTEILNDQRCKVKGRGSDEIRVTFWEPSPVSFKRMHDFLVYPKDDKIVDLTCNRNCPYIFALAFKMGWIKMPKSSVRASPWVHFKTYGKARLELRDGEFVLRYRDKFANCVICRDNITGLKNVLTLYGKAQGWSNLKTKNYEWMYDRIKKEAKKQNQANNEI